MLFRGVILILVIIKQSIFYELVSMIIDSFDTHHTAEFQMNFECFVAFVMA